jgi:glycerol-3-phosphate acyltransferase PlsY
MPDPLGDLSYTWPLLAALIGGYLLGSIPFGLVLTKLAGFGDVRKIGSGSIGATNVLRTGNKMLALLTLLLDGGKGAAAVLIAQTMGPDMAVLAAAGALLGHVFPVWLRFKGGKGFATYLGIMLTIAWPVGILCCLTWLVIAAVFRFSSLASLVAAGAGPIYMIWLSTPQLMELAGALVLLIFLRHHQNIRRLLRGEEPKIGKSGDNSGASGENNA